MAILGINTKDQWNEMKLEYFPMIRSLQDMEEVILSYKDDDFAVEWNERGKHSDE
eukprot:CAMPEP_0117747984 /NCGR_PEP_ID=MMETSP0947-20121206/8817_1 /TAXON_ID=44440 /ORGANISM="Chattonella subsalsa, Strain CCMP2191" /LENGTH=54 /DNA_ID=CAMNT_0005565503 /DNA_START=51 /DNA_END=212 /DNA_ORIENTATION=-